MYRLLPDAAARVSLTVDGAPVEVPAGASVAAALLVAGATPTRVSTVSAAPRAPYCMMGVCFECLVEIDGIPSQQGCLVQVRPGMRIKRQNGRPEIGP